MYVCLCCYDKLEIASYCAGHQPSALFSLASNCCNSVETEHSSAGIDCHVFGQPVSATHPHMISEGELVTGVALREFQERRNRLMLGIKKFARDHLPNADSGEKTHLVKVVLIVVVKL